MKISKDLALVFDDILLQPCYSDILPFEAQLQTQFTRNISLSIPIISAAMDTVTESETATVMAQKGGIGVIHKNLSIEDQKQQVIRVKKYVSGMITDPVSVYPDDDLEKVREITSRYKISGVPVVDKSDRLVGILTNRDLRFESNWNQKVGAVMTKDNLVTTKEGTTLEEAKVILQKYRIEKLPVVDSDFKLKGLITFKDIKKSITYPNANKDHQGRLRVAAAIGVGEKELLRAEALVESAVDVLVIDTAHGHSLRVLEMLKELRSQYSSVDIVAGNVATEEACRAFIERGVDGIKVGIGPGSICTTRVISGVGVPQVQALLNCRKICRGEGVPFISDGGIKYSGDVVKALSLGASSVMIGSLFAGTDEAPGEMIFYHGRSYKVYRGMGSLGAMNQGSRDRYAQDYITDDQKLVPEGIEGQVLYSGSLSGVMHQIVGGLRAGMGYVGARNLDELYEKAEFITITSQSLQENHPHDVLITKEAPNYRLKN